jgi:hypothetical protein
MQNLNFPAFQFRFKNIENKPYIFDIIRKKFVLVTPEEWVRQHTVHFLIENLKYPKNYINVEKQLTINNLVKRYDIVVYLPNGKIFLLVECKAPEIAITQKTFDQIAQYNFILQADNLMLTNGLNHYFCTMNLEQKKYLFLKELPSYPSF